MIWETREKKKKEEKEGRKRKKEGKDQRNRGYEEKYSLTHLIPSRFPIHLVPSTL